jgi:hypothetical protein
MPAPIIGSNSVPSPPITDIMTTSPEVTQCRLSVST